MPYTAPPNRIVGRSIVLAPDPGTGGIAFFHTPSGLKVLTVDGNRNIYTLLLSGVYTRLAGNLRVGWADGVNLINSNILNFRAGDLGALLGQYAVHGTDNRSGITAPDSSPVTLLTTPNLSGLVYAARSHIIATSWTSGTVFYDYKWTENGIVRTRSVSVAAANAMAFDQFLFKPDANTAIQVQVTGTFTATVSVAAVAERFA